MSKAILAGLCLSVSTLLFNTSAVGICNASGKVAPVKVVGEALTLGAKPKENALENAKQKAVKKAVARLIAPSDDPNSLYRKTIANYKKYAKDNIVISKTQKLNGKLLIFCDVPVDYGDIQEDISKEISNYQNQEKHAEDTAVFLVRVKGLPNLNGEEQRIPIIVLYDYGMAFSHYGFASYGSDAGGDAYKMMADSAKSFGDTQGYAEYREAVIKSLLEDVSVTFAVIGEINLKEASANATGKYIEADCIVEVVKPKADSSGVEVIGKFSDGFSANARDENEAAKIVCKKASVNSSKHLADITHEYWQSHK